MSHPVKEPIPCVPYPPYSPTQGHMGSLMETQEEELRLIAQELHDDLGQRLALFQIQIDRLEHRCESPAIVNGLRTLRESVEEMDRDIHRICHRLYPVVLDQLGLTVALESFCREFSTCSGVRTTFIHENLPRHLAKDVSLCLYRLVQEALHNVSKHSGARRATVILRGSINTIEVLVEDLGSGFHPNALEARRGLGLANMEQRVLSIGGRYILRSTPGAGTVVRAILPRSA